MPQKPVPEKLKGPISDEERVRWGAISADAFHSLPPGDEKLRGRYVRSVMRAKGLRSLPRKERVFDDTGFDMLGIDDPRGFWRRIFVAAGGAKGLRAWVKKNPTKFVEKLITMVQKGQEEKEQQSCPRCRDVTESSIEEARKRLEQICNGP